MRRVIGTVVTGLVGMAMVGCQGGQPGSAVSVANVSETAINVRASLDGEAGGEISNEITLESGTSQGFQLLHPEGMSTEPPVRFVVSPTAGGRPYELLMTPPGPYILRISGPAMALELERDRISSSTRDLESIPDDPQRRRYRGEFNR